MDLGQILADGTGGMLAEVGPFLADFKEIVTGVSKVKTLWAPCTTVTDCKDAVSIVKILTKEGASHPAKSAVRQQSGAPRC